MNTAVAMTLARGSTRWMDVSSRAKRSSRSRAERPVVTDDTVPPASADRARRGGHELAVLDALGTDEPVGDPFDVAGDPAQHDHLEAVDRVEVHVQGRDDLLVVGVLVLGQLVGCLL